MSCCLIVYLFFYYAADMDPQTIWKLPKWQHIRGNQDRDAPRVTTADHIHALKPDAKFIVMMRDPVERYRYDFLCMRLCKKNWNDNIMIDESPDK